MAVKVVASPKDIDLGKLTPKQLKELADQATERLNQTFIERCITMKEKLTKLCDDEGLTLSQVFFGGKQGGGPGTVKFRNPETGQSWTGKGKKPHWLYGHESEFTVS